MERRYFKVLIPATVRVGAGTTVTFPTRSEAEGFLRDQKAETTGTIYEVDEIGRRIEPKTIGLASVGSLGGIEEYLCTHCWHRADLPDVAHNCYDFGRDDSTKAMLPNTTSGTLSLRPIYGIPQKEFLVDWVMESGTDTWRTVLTNQEMVKLMKTNHWGAEVSNLW